MVATTSCRTFVGLQRHATSMGSTHHTAHHSWRQQTPVPDRRSAWAHTNFGNIPVSGTSWLGSAGCTNTASASVWTRGDELAQTAATQHHTKRQRTTTALSVAVLKPSVKKLHRNFNASITPWRLSSCSSGSNSDNVNYARCVNGSTCSRDPTDWSTLPWSTAVYSRRALAA